MLCYCCVLQEGKVVLGGPGSFYWQGESTKAARRPPINSSSEQNLKECVKDLPLMTESDVQVTRVDIHPWPLSCFLVFHPVPQVSWSQPPLRRSSRPTTHRTFCSQSPGRFRPDRHRETMTTATWVRVHLSFNGRAISRCNKFILLFIFISRAQWNSLKPLLCSIF